MTTIAMAADTGVDFVVSGGGTVYLVTPQNDAALEHLTENVSDEAQWLGTGLAVEHRFINTLAEQLMANGWVVE